LYWFVFNFIFHGTIPITVLLINAENKMNAETAHNQIPME